jgi:hypothetical protein
VGPKAAAALSAAGIRIEITEVGKDLGEAMADAIVPLK